MRSFLGVCVLLSNAVATSCRRHWTIGVSLAALMLGTAVVKAESELVLPTLVVTATSTEHLLRDAPASVSVITREELSLRPVQDLSDALRGSTSISITSVGLGRRGISIRGNRTDHTLVLIDGRRINAAADAIAHSDFDLGWVPVEAIERIEVVRGPMSSLYGSEALGGVVNIITRRATDQWIGSVNLNGGLTEHSRGGETYQTAGYMGGPIIKDVLGLNVWGEIRGREELVDAFDPQRSSLDERLSFIGNATLTWTPTLNQRIDLGYTGGFEERRRHTQSTGPMPTYYRSDDDIWRHHLSLSHEGDWDWGKSRVRVYRSSLERENRRTDGITGRPQKLIDTVADAQFTVPLWGSHLFTVGGEIRREELEDEVVNLSGEAEQMHYAAFIQDQISLAPNWSIVAGSRFDRHEEYGWQISPRVYSVYHVNEALILKGGVGQGFKAPSLKQLSPEYEAVAGGGRFTIIGNPDLNPETSTSYEFGFEFAHGIWNATVMAFHNDLDNLIQTTCIVACGVPGQELRTYENVERARIRGVEVTAGVELMWNLHLHGNYTYLDPRDLTNDRLLADRSRHSANARLVWSPRPDFTAQLRAEYVGTQVTYSGAEEIRRPSYSLWSVELNYRLTEQLTLQAGVENITDQRLADASELYPIANPGRLYYAGMKARF